MTGKCYVGQTKETINRRLSRHFSDAINRPEKSKRSKLWAAIRKYGEENFLIEVLEECSDAAALNERELFWIEHLDTIDSGYNIAKGGNVEPWSEERKKHFSETHPLKGVTGSDHPAYGYRHSEEAKRRIAQAAKGRKISDEERQRRSERIKAQGGIPNSDLGRQRRAERIRREGSPLKGRKHSEEQNEKHRQVMTGRKLSEDHRRKISEALKGRQLSDEHREKLRKSKSRTVGKDGYMHEA